MALVLRAPILTQAQELLVADFESFPEGYITRELVDGGIRFSDLDNRFPDQQPSGPLLSMRPPPSTRTGRASIFSGADSMRDGCTRFPDRKTARSSLFRRP
jgi:hypothetical protein